MSTIDIVWVFAFQRKSNVAVTLAVACKYAVQDRRAPIRLRSGQAVTRPTERRPARLRKCYGAPSRAVATSTTARIDIRVVRFLWRMLAPRFAVVGR